MSFFYNEASLERPSIALKQCICGVGISSDNVRLPEMESERDAVDHLLWFSLPQVSFSPTARERTCLNLSLCLLLSSSLSPLLISPEKLDPRHFTLRGICHKPSFSHAHLHPHKPQNRCTNIGTSTSTCTLLKYVFSENKHRRTR